MTHFSGNPITRRQALRSSITLGLGLAAMAAPTRVLAQVPRHRAIRLGAFEIIVLSDGHLELPSANFGANVSDRELAQALAGSPQARGAIAAPTNVTLVRSGADLILIDVGAGPNFMETAGKLPLSLAAAGIDPASITKVVLTHGHPDHLWGAIDEFDDSHRFPKAAYVISEAEWALWMTGDASAKVPATRQNFIPGAKRNLAQLKNRITTVKPGQDVHPGITAIDTAGHTQGHISLEIAAGNERLIVLGDALTHPVISFRYPEWRPVADHEAERAVATRKGLLDRLATDKARIIGFHLPFPGLGIVERRGATYAFAPAT